MPKMHINKSIKINASPEKIHEVISDFKQWPAWSPWLIAEPEAVVNYREDGLHYDWEGNRIGTGNMTIEKNTPGKIDYDLTFLKPWKSKAKVAFKLNPHEDHTHVSWTMDSSLPFFLFWMKKSMEAFVGMDYDRGLKMLKEYVEDGQIKSKLEFKGMSDFAGCNYIGVKRSTTQEGMQTDMGADFEKVNQVGQANPDNVTGAPFSIYHKFDPVKDRVDYTVGLPVKDIPADLPADVMSGAIPATKVYTLRHVGSYAHLGNAWTTMSMMVRNKEFKTVKGIHPFETYGNMPGEVPEEELITDINFAVKS